MKRLMFHKALLCSNPLASMFRPFLLQFGIGTITVYIVFFVAVVGFALCLWWQLLERVWDRVWDLWQPVHWLGVGCCGSGSEPGL
jgi:hypothetical protein